MYTVALIGGIGSGKSTVARMLAEKGAARIDLDQLSRDVCAPGSPVLAQIADEFGDDVLDETGALRRDVLAARAFASPEALARLEAIEHPAITELLWQRVAELGAGGDGDGAAGHGAGGDAGDDAADYGAPACCVIEVPLPQKVPELLSRVDDVTCVACPVDVRRVRAIGRGMTGEDFDARAARQLDDAGLAALATSVIDNAGSADDLLASVSSWWDERESAGWGRA